MGVKASFTGTCPARWIRPKLGSFDRSLFNLRKRRGDILEKSARQPSCESPLKIPHHLIQLLPIRHLMAKCAVRCTPLRLCHWFTSYKDWKIRYEKIHYQWPMVNKLFLTVINRFSLVKAAMNAPHVCKNCLTVIDQCAIVLKTPQFFHFSINTYITSAQRIFAAPI
jgi:hypothetical protein